MKYLKLYEQFRLILESSDWKETIEIDGKEYKINWGMPKFEIAEIFQTLKHHKSSLPKGWIDSFGKIFDSEMPSEFNLQREPKEEYIRKTLDGSMKGKENDVTTEYSSFDLLNLKKLGKATGKNLEPYHNFIKEMHNLFWKDGKNVQLTESQIKQLAENKGSEEGTNETGFHKAYENPEFIDGEFKIYYDIWAKTPDNPNGILEPERIGQKGCLDVIKENLSNMKEPNDPNHKELWKKYRSDNPEEIQKFASEIYSKILNYQNYFGKSFGFFAKTIKEKGIMPLSAAVEINGNLYLTGGNRRMTFYCYQKVLPTIWIWNKGGNFMPGSALDKDADKRPIQFGKDDSGRVKSDREREAQGNFKRGNFSD